MFHTCPVKISRMEPSSMPSWRCGEKSHHGNHHAGQKAEDRNRLQRIEQRDHESLGSRVVRGDVAVDDGENKAEKVGDGDAQHGKHRVFRKHAGREADFGRAR